jgi:two-component system response regulator NreC
MTSAAIRILVVDDHAIVREGLRAVIESDAKLVVVGEAEDGRAAVLASRDLHPDLVLMDLSMRGVSGLDAIREIKRRYADIKVVVFTVHKTEEYVLASLEAGADGYVLKECGRAELTAAIRSVASGKFYLCPDATSSVVVGYLHGGVKQGIWGALTHREREILKLVAEGRRSREIAGYLSISLKTVEKHRQNVMRKLDVRNAQALTAFAIRRGLVGA